MRQQRQSVRAVKGNAVAECNTAVPFMSLSVSVIDVDAGEVVAKNPKPMEATNVAQIESLETIVPCVNNDPTHYQVTALGVSQEGEGEDRKFYDEIEFGKIAVVNCGHA